MKRSNRKRKKKRRLKDEDASGSAFVRKGNAPKESEVQAALGNRALQRLIRQGRVEGSLPLDGRVVQRLKLGDEPLKGALLGAIQRQIDDVDAQALQREGEADGESEADTGEVTIGEPEVEYYDVRGSSLAEILPQLDPEEWGRCNYQFDYTYDSEEGRSTRVNIELTLHIRLPRWGGEGHNSASDAAKAEWERMLGVLEAHEDHHAEIARTWAPRFKERLLGLPVGQISARYNEIYEQMQAEQDQYDEDTDHGQNEGVRLDTSIE